MESVSLKTKEIGYKHSTQVDEVFSMGLGVHNSETICILELSS